VLIREVTGVETRFSRFHFIGEYFLTVDYLCFSANLVTVRGSDMEESMYV
jgi:hypothetical protein